MIYDLNGAVPLEWRVGEDLGAVSVVVVDPIGTVHNISGGPFQSSAPLGTYRAGNYVPTVPGRYTVTWTSATRAYSDIFDVRPAFRYALVSVQDAKEYLRLRPTDVRNYSDATLAGIIEGASIAVQNITGPIVPQTFTEQYDGGNVTVVVENKPVIAGSVSVTEVAGSYSWTLTEQPPGTVVVDAYGFSVNYATGRITRRTQGFANSFACGRENILVTYRAGRLTIPDNVILATKELVRHLWAVTQVPGRRPVAQSGEDGYGWVPTGFAVPNFVVQMLQNDQRPPGIA